MKAKNWPVEQRHSSVSFSTFFGSKWKLVGTMTIYIHLLYICIIILRLKLRTTKWGCGPINANKEEKHN